MLSLKKVLRYRYYCEFCGKVGGSGGHIRKHEEACTKNPSRVCRMCRMMGNEQPSIELLTAMLPNPQEYVRRHFSENGSECGWLYVGLESAVEKSFPALRDATGNCPACLMAALRQKGIPVPCSPLKFSEECKEIWDSVNAAAYEESLRNERVW